jgi:hypothetical protein
MREMKREREIMGKKDMVECTIIQLVLNIKK